MKERREPNHCRPGSASCGPGGTFGLQAIIAVPLVLGLVALLIFLTVSSSTAHACRAGTAPRVTSCQSVSPIAGPLAGRLAVPGLTFPGALSR
jgi:hypothetical protein